MMTQWFQRIQVQSLIQFAKYYSNQKSSIKFKEIPERKKKSLENKNKGTQCIEVIERKKNISKCEFKCNQCDYKCSRSYYLTSHKRIHTK